MMKIAENYARVKTLDLPVGSTRGSLGSLSAEGTYTISFTYVVHSGEVVGSFMLYAGMSIDYIPQSESRISFTFEVDASHIGSNLNLYSDVYAAPAKENHVTFYDIHIARGTQGADIWTPAHDDLTPEQITTLPPYGEYKEIKSF